MIGVSASRNCSIKIRRREFENASCVSSRNVYSFHTRRVRRNVMRLGLIRMCSTNHGHPCRTWHRVDERHWNKEGPRGMMSFRVPKRCPILNGESPFVKILSLSRKREREQPIIILFHARSKMQNYLYIRAKKISKICFQYTPLVEKENEDLVHHIILYECASTLPILGQHARIVGAPCYSPTMPREWESCLQPVLAWARGSTGKRNW